MQKHLVVTVSGQDHPGIVNYISKLVLEYHGNVEGSRMARLGGEFAILMMVSVQEEKFDALCDGMNQLQKEDYQVTMHETERGTSSKYNGWLPYQVEVTGADHEGIIHDLSRYLTEHKINIETMDTDVIKAPMSGTPLFKMVALIVVPPELSYSELKDAMAHIGDTLGVDTELSPYAG
jgi:glycine cleavage system transcriptional repressor